MVEDMCVNDENTVYILMSTYNGEKYLEDQIDSIINQTYKNIILLVRDDGSTDATINIIRNYSANNDRIIYLDELSRRHCEAGIGSSFFTLLRYALEHFENANYFCFSDQDDVWFEDKIQRAVDAIRTRSDKKILYFTNKVVVDEQLNLLYDEDFRFQDNFIDFLDQGIAAGCTMMINRLYAEQIMAADVESFPYLHDVVLFRTALCTDVEIIYDRISSMYYRQHSANSEGAKNNRLFTKNNIKKLVKKKRHFLSKLSSDILLNYSPYLRPGYDEKLKRVISYSENLFTRLALYKLYKEEGSVCIKGRVRFAVMIFFNGV